MANLQEFVNKLNKPRTYLLLTNIFLVFFLILLSNLKVLPVRNLPDFMFYTAIYLAFALYRPGWSFLFFVGTIALENISLAPKEIGIMVRPYQFIGGLTILAVLIKLAARRLGFKLPKWNWYDLLFVIFTAAGFLSAIFSANKNISIKQAVIATSFAALYFLARIFIQNLEDLKKIAPFFLSSSMIVVFYGIWQNVRFIHGANPFEFMPGRPNGTFTEPDWFGIFLVLLLTAFFTLIYDLRQEPASRIRNYKLVYLHACLVLIFSVIIITVSRSAWLGASAVIFAFLFLLLTGLKINPARWQWKFFSSQLIAIAITIALSLGIVYAYNLTRFQLFNRAQSTSSGLQKITVSCTQEITLPEKIESIDELAQYGCKHINLEEIQNEETEGNFVMEIFRTDPNVNIRSIIYQKSWAQIKSNFLFGIGWGNIGKILGTDANGNVLNSSNIFLEVWLGTGLLGITAFVLIWIFVIIKAVKFFISSNPGGKPLGLFLFLGAVALIVPNLFNAGVFLGIIWLFFAMSNMSEHK